MLLYLKKTLWVCFACLMAGFLAFSAFAMQDFLLVLALAAVLASLVHTVVVLGLLAVCFADLGVGLMAILLTIVSLNGSLEIIAAGVVATAVCKPVLAYLHRHN